MNTENLKFIAPLIEKEIRDGSIAGASLMILKDNEEILKEVYGYSNIENQQPMRLDTIFRLYSMTKPVTAVAAMILYERGQLDLFAPVSKYLDGFKNQKVYTKDGLVDVKRDVTIQDLLNMTSGVVYPDQSYEVGRIMEKLYDDVIERRKRGDVIDTIELSNLIGQVPLEFQPAENWRYGASADVIGAIIEIISGKKYSDFLQDEIFTPLGMIDTAFYVPEDKLDRFSMIYEYKEDKHRLEQCHWNFLGLGDYLTPPSFESGGAGLVSTIEDYKKFALMLVNGGTYNGVRILGRKTVDYMSKNQLTPPQMKGYNWEQLVGYGYGNLMRVLVDKTVAASNGSVGEFGWDGWSGNYFFVDPEEKLILIYVIQRCGGGKPEIIRKLRSITYSLLD